MPPRTTGPLFIYGYERVSCEGYAIGMDRFCPNCGGELVRRPGRGKEGS